jgi:5-methylcytosine-specific restriction endonuclease McrA
MMRAEAKQQELPRYFGKVCRKHPALNGERQTADAHCPDCRREKNLTSYHRHGEVRRAHSRNVYHADIEQARARGRANSKKRQPQQAVYKREWRAANKERCTTVDRAYRESNREHVDTYQRDWYVQHRAQVATRNRLHRQNNKEKIDGRAKAWRQNNKAHWKAMMANRRGRERAAIGKFTKDDIQRMWDQQSGICIAPNCNTALTVSCTIDHIIPLSRSGSNWPTNLQLMCKSCNCSKGTKTMSEWLCREDVA